MIHDLTDDQIEYILRSEMIGRIGCTEKGKTYVVPTAYVYDGKYIYAHSKEGAKINIMRKNPTVCFQLDVIETMASWRSVILWGVYEELKTGVLQARALKLLNDRFTPLMVTESVKPSLNTENGRIVEKMKKPVFYRIAITERSGRYEKGEY